MWHGDGGLTDPYADAEEVRNLFESDGDYELMDVSAVETLLRGEGSDFDTFVSQALAMTEFLGDDPALSIKSRAKRLSQECVRLLAKTLHSKTLPVEKALEEALKRQNVLSELVDQVANQEIVFRRESNQYEMLVRHFYNDQALNEAALDLKNTLLNEHGEETAAYEAAEKNYHEKKQLFETYSGRHLFLRTFLTLADSIVLKLEDFRDEQAIIRADLAQMSMPPISKEVFRTGDNPAQPEGAYALPQTGTPVPDRTLTAPPISWAVETVTPTIQAGSRSELPTLVNAPIVAARKRIALAVAALFLGGTTVVGAGTLAYFFASRQQSHAVPLASGPGLEDVNYGELANREMPEIESPTVDPVPEVELQGKEDLLSLYSEYLSFFSERDRVSGLNTPAVIAAIRTEAYVTQVIHVETDPLFDPVQVFDGEKEMPMNELEGPIVLDQDNQVVQVFLPIYAPEPTSLTLEWQLDGETLETNEIKIENPSPFYGVRAMLSLNPKKVKKGTSTLTLLVLLPGADPVEYAYELLNEAEALPTRSSSPTPSRPRVAPQPTPIPSEMPLKPDAPEAEAFEVGPSAPEVLGYNQARLFASAFNGSQEWKLAAGEGGRLELTLAGPEKERIKWILAFDSSPVSYKGSFKLEGETTKSYFIDLPPTPETAGGGMATLQVEGKDGVLLTKRFTVSD